MIRTAHGMAKRIVLRSLRTKQHENLKDIKAFMDKYKVRYDDNLYPPAHRTKRGEYVVWYKSRIIANVRYIILFTFNVEAMTLTDKIKLNKYLRLLNLDGRK